MIVQVNYTAKWRLKGNENYVWTECKKLINLKTNRIINKSVKGVQVGYWINKEFVTLTKLKERIELIPKIDCPF